MHRTQIYLNPAQQKLLKEIAIERHATLSELIREAVWNFVAQYRKPKADALTSIIGLYHNKEDREGAVRHDDIYA